jgi:Kdo2-lipid IVA lauroyltransferase/acyltransferase
MDALLYWMARALVFCVQALPLPLAARLGRTGGGLAWWLDARHRRMTLHNLTRCLGSEKTPAEIRHLGHEVFRRLGENYVCAIRTAAMTEADVGRIVEVGGANWNLPEP